MTTTTVKTIGATGDYPDMASWEAAAPANLVTSDVVWQGQLQNQVHTGTVTIAGSTSDATRYKELTCVPGASFSEHANVQTNALRYNAANGAAISVTSGYVTAVNLTENYARLTGVQVQTTDANSAPIGAANTGVIINRCILEGKGNSTGAVINGASIRNSLIVNRKATACAYILDINQGSAIYNSTLVSAAAVATAGVTGTSSTNTLKSVAIFNVAAVKAGVSVTTYTTCFTDMASPPSGCTTVAYDTTTGSGFESITDGSHDLRIKATSAMVDAGTTDATYGTPDIANSARPDGVGYDVGAWEYISPINITCTDKTQHIFQRVGNSKTLTFSGTYGGAAPASIELQLYKAVDDSIVQAYTPLVGATIGGGMWSASYAVPATDYYYKFSVRSRDGGGTVLATSTTTANAWGVGIIASCIGQSLMALMFGSNIAPSVSVPTRMYTTVGGWRAVTGYGAVYLADSLAAATGVVVGLLSYGYNNTGLHSGGSEYWMGLTPGGVYDRYATGLAAVGGDCEVVFWFQGEADAQVPNSKSVYKADLDTLYGRIRTITGRSTTELKFGCYFMGRYSGAISGALTDATWDAIRQAHMEWTRDTTGAFVAHSAVTMPLSGDQIHWTNDAPGFGRAGKRSAQAYLKQLGLVTYGADGPRITSAEITAATVVLTVAQDGGTVLMEADGSTDGGTLTGFELSNDDFSTLLTIASTAFGGSGIVITLSSVPTGTVKLRYQYGLNPAVTNAVYDNTSPQDDTIGMPLQPTFGVVTVAVNLSQLSGDATVGMLTAGGVLGLAPKYVSVILTTDGETPVGGLSDLKWAWFDSVNPALFGAPTDKGDTGSTDGAGLFKEQLSNSTASVGQAGWLVVTNSDGTTTQIPSANAFSGPSVVVS